MNPSPLQLPFTALLPDIFNDVAIHNVRLLDVASAPDGLTMLSVELDGVVTTLPGGAPWSDEWSRRDVGRIGHLVRAFSLNGERRPLGACYFRPYLDQNLRRAPELDGPDNLALAHGRAPCTIGWRCANHAFRAPAGLIPGQNGAFVPDRTVPLTLRIPPEFVRECERVQMSPEAVLRGFIADLAGVSNDVACPRADRYSSNGSDERLYAENWLERAFGMQRIDLEAREAEEAERQENRDLLLDLVDDYLDGGGEVEALQAALERMLVEQQALREE